MTDSLTLRQELDKLREDHRALDEEIAALSCVSAPDQITLQRLKKSKLKLKDRITRIENLLIPDIIA